MIHEELVTYEVAKLAKEKGFPIKEIRSWHYEFDGYPTKEIIDEYQYPNISQSLLQRWLREEKKIEAYVRNFEKSTDFPHHYCNFITDGNGKTSKVGNKMFDTYEQALEDALKYSLENLV